MLDEIKRSLNINGLNEEQTAQLDQQLSDFIKRITKRLLIRINEEVLPKQLEYIVIEATISRFNLIGNEGMQTYSQEGESIHYQSILKEYEDDIQAYISNQQGLKDADGKLGKVRFI